MELSSRNLRSHVGMTMVGSMTQNWPKFVSNVTWVLQDITLRRVPGSTIDMGSLLAEERVAHCESMDSDTD